MALNKAGIASLASVSCASAGNCSASGSYLRAPGHLQAFVADEVEKSHSKSQRGQISGDIQLRQATVEAGQVPSEPHRATSSDTREVTGGQGVAGSCKELRRLISAGVPGLHEHPRLVR